MNDTCAGCGKELESDWKTCPYCGRPVTGAGGTAMVQMITKIVTSIIEAGLSHAEESATRQGKHSQAQQLAMARRIAKEVTPLIVEAITVYGSQARSKSKASKPGRGSSLAKGLAKIRRGSADEEDEDEVDVDVEDET